VFLGLCAFSCIVRYFGIAAHGKEMIKIVAFAVILIRIELMIS
jgi:hypothetical protein